MGKRKVNLTGECQICGEELAKGCRSDKMTCGVKRCATRWTRHAKMLNGIQWKTPTGLDRLANSGEFDDVPFHQMEISLEKWKMFHDAIGEAIMIVENRQADKAAKLGISYSSQFGFHNFIVHGRDKR